MVLIACPPEADTEGRGEGRGVGHCGHMFGDRATRVESAIQVGGQVSGGASLVSNGGQAYDLRGKKGVGIYCYVEVRGCTLHGVRNRYPRLIPTMIIPKWMRLCAFRVCHLNEMDGLTPTCDCMRLTKTNETMLYMLYGGSE